MPAVSWDRVAEITGRQHAQRLLVGEGVREARIGLAWPAGVVGRPPVYAGMRPSALARLLRADRGQRDAERLRGLGRDGGVGAVGQRQHRERRGHRRGIESRHVPTPSGACRGWQRGPGGSPSTRAVGNPENYRALTLVVHQHEAAQACARRDARIPADGAVPPGGLREQQGLVGALDGLLDLDLRVERREPE